MLIAVKLMKLAARLKEKEKSNTSCRQCCLLLLHGLKVT
uniref:Uncharacterized protein n=1 Tax=Arundo donax TaxID=35708 RepID=A0A0A9BBH2_ARUDO